MTRRQNNNQWSGGIAAHPAPNNSACKNLLEKFSPRFFWDQRTKLSVRSITHLWWCNWRIFWRKNAAGISPSGSYSCTTTPRLTGHLQPRRNWPTWTSNILITQPILRNWPRRTTTCSLDWKKQLKVSNFSSEAEVIAATETWLDGKPSEFFWVAKVRAMGREVYWASWGVCWINSEFGRCSLFPSWSS